MNKVYLCKEFYYDGCDIWDRVVKVVDDEVKALLWQEETDDTGREWREYDEMEVE